MSVTNAISSVIIVGALIAAAAAGSASSKWLGLVAVALASVNIFGGFAVTARIVGVYKKRGPSAMHTEPIFTGPPSGLIPFLISRGCFILATPRPSRPG